MDFDITALPWATLLTLASGYSGYFIANIGVRDHHKTIDVTFSTLVFGFFGTVAYVLGMSLQWHIVAASLSAFVCASALGAVWAKWGRRFMHWILRATNISHNDDLATAFDALVTETRTEATQLSVKLENDMWLLCDNLSQFAGQPNGPFVLGRSGDLLMYVTHCRHGNEDYEACDGLDAEGWGTEVTYIPAAKIARIDIRRKWRRALPTSS